MISFGERAELCENQTAKKLFQVMQEKRSNLALSADFTRAEELLHFAERLASEICLFKTHIDILEDFTPEVTKQLTLLAKKGNFLLFEDRKFADIGQTVKSQYEKGVYRIADWADITNAHIISGPGVIQGLKEVGAPKKRGLLLLAEMSSDGTLAQGNYTQKAVEMAKQHADFVIGFICLRKLSEDPRFIHMTPGVQLKENQDSLGQRYRTPQSVISAGSDLIIVGRGITGDKDPLYAAHQHKEAAWKAYAQRY
jgi:uridine monophosphate synthetase